MKNINFIWLFLTNRSFRSKLKKTILYAFNVSDTVRGHQSTSVELFKKYEHIIFNDETITKLYFDDGEFKIPPNILINILSAYNVEELDEIKNYKN